MSTDSETANIVSVVGGGVVGGVAALAVKQPKTVREGMWRTVAGAVTSVCFTGWVCEYLSVPADRYYKVVTVGVGVGFCGWHILTILMVILDTLLETAQRERLGFVVALLKLLRGGVVPADPAKPKPEGEK